MPASRPFRVTVLTLVGLLCDARASGSSDAHYQDSLLGERAAGMGGAFTALGNEATGTLYNPAGIVVDGSTLIQLSMSAFKLRHKSVDVGNVCGRPIGTDEGGFFGVPGAVGFVKLLQSGSVRHALGVTLAVPFADRGSQAVVLNDVDCGTVRLDQGISAISLDRVFVGGLTYAIQPWPWLRAGMTFGLALRDVNATELAVSAVAGSGYPGVTLTHIDVAFWSAFLQWGVIVAPPGGLSFGLSLTSPYLHLSGGGRLDIAASSTDPTAWQESQLIVIEDAQYEWRVPLRLALGAAYSRPRRFTLALDLSVHLPVDSYPIVAAHPALPDEVNAALPTAERRAVVNVNLGGELYLRPSVALRGGLFTNFTSQPKLDPGAIGADDRLHYFGLSLGGSYLTDSSSLSLVLVGQIGAGDAPITRVSGGGAAGEPLIESAELADALDFSLVFAIGGNYDLR